MDQVTNSDEEFWENEYPFVSPDHSIIDVGDNARYLTDLSALETAFVKWFIELGVSDESFKRCIHPAFPFGSKQKNSRTVFARPKVKQAIKNLRRALPFLSVYNSDYLIGILHEEIEHFRVSNRYERFRSDNVDTIYFGGKKSLHEEEMLEAKLLLDCVKQVQELAGIGSTSNNGQPNSGPSDENIGLNRVIGETEKLIAECQARLGTETDPAVNE